MGIPSYFSHIVRQHRKIIKEYKKSRMAIHNLYLDCNSFIYESIHELNKKFKEQKPSANEMEDEIIRLVCNKIASQLTDLKPTNNVLIAFDGVAPVAKLEQQRNRRYKSWFEERIMEQVDEKYERMLWDTASITPGTAFMGNLGKAVKRRFLNPKEFGLKRLMISDSNEVGEGEHKIYDYIRSNKVQHETTTTVVYGLDADLIILTLNHLNIAPNMYLFRETPHFINSIDKTLNPNELYLMDIPEFGKMLALDLNDGQEPNTKQQKNRIYDYILLSFFLGNDFLPHFPALNIRTNGIDRLMDAYRRVIGSTNENLVDGDKIVWKNVRKMLTVLAESEEDLITDEYHIRDKQEKFANRPQKTIHGDFMAIPLKERGEEEYINPFVKGWRDRYYNILFDMKIDDMRKKQISINYLEGLEWTFKYYTIGCVDWRWTYKYDYPPLLDDLIRYIPYFDTTFVVKTDSVAVSPYVQLSYVLPARSLYLLPSPIHSYLIQNHRDWYGDDYEFCWTFCKYFWESHVKLPPIELEKLENIIINI
jgi:5'-3' exoribonuclease 2